MFALQITPTSSLAKTGLSRYDFIIEANTLGEALDEFVQLTGAQLIFSHDLANATDINPVVGYYSVEKALDVLLKNTRFSGGLTKGGMIVVSLKTDRRLKKMIKNKRLFTSLSVLLAAQSYAQDSAPSADFLLEEVIVTAQKREQSANDIGMSVSVFSGDALEQLGVADTADLANLIPGFTFADTGFTTPVYTLRGVGFSELSVQAQSTVGVYYDQIAAPYPIMTSGLEIDTQRVEVLKGPQGTLFGRNSTGGAINYIANRPSDEVEASITADYSTFETLDLTGIVSVPFSENGGARLALRKVDSGEGWQESVTRSETLGEQDRFAARLMVDFAPSDDLDLNLTLRHWTDNSDTQVPQFLQSDVQRPTRANIVDILDNSEFARIPLAGTDDNQAADWTGGNNRLNKPVADMESSSVSGTVKWDLSDSISLNSLTAFSNFKNNSTYENGGWAGVPLDTPLANGTQTVRDTISPLVRGLYDNFDNLGSVGYTNQAEIDAFSQELRLNGVSDSVTWLAGVYFSSDEVQSNTPQLVEFNSSTNLGHFAGTGLQGVENPTEQDSESWSVFAHTEWTLSDPLLLTLGLRYTEDEKDYSGCTADTGDGDLADFFNTGFGAAIYSPGECAMLDDTLDETQTSIVPLTSPFEQELNEDSLSWRLGLDYRISDDILTYVSYSRGFKSGSFPTLTADRISSLLPVVQEQLDAFEIGAKTTFLDGRVRLNGSLFYYDYQDKQLFTKVITEFGSVNALANIPESKVTGAEFDLSWAPADGWFVSLGATYIDTEVEEFQGFNQVAIEGDFSGSEFPLAPELQATALINYDFDIGSKWYGFANMNLNYSSKSYSDYSISEVLDSGNGSRYAALLTRYDVAVGDTMEPLDVFELPDTLQVGARIGMTSSDEKISIALWGRNLTDEYIRNNSRKSSDGIIGYTGMPRTYGISVSYSL